MPDIPNRLSGYHIILCLESPIVAMEIEFNLEEEGASVTNCNTAVEVLAALDVHSFDFAIIDQEMTINPALGVADIMTEHGIQTIQFTHSLRRQQQGKRLSTQMVIERPFDNSRLASLVHLWLSAPHAGSDRSQ